MTLNLQGASIEDLNSVQHGQPVAQCPKSPADISPQTNDPNPTTGQLAAEMEILRVHIANIDAGLELLKTRFENWLADNYRGSKEY